MDKDIDILARTLYGEARGEVTSLNGGGINSLIAVGNVVMNRLKYPKFFGKTVSEVCLKPYQFSCWNKNDPNFPILQNITLDNKVFSLCVEVGTQLLNGKKPDLTGHSEHYHATTLPCPLWAVGRTPKVIIGRHIFYQVLGGICSE